jgi:Fic-DOC domain mobile mystery protein B
MKFYYDKNSTPINPSEIRNLVPSHIQFQSELNMWEQSNIEEAESKLFVSKKPLTVTIDFIKKLHLMMFDKTWKWAGQFRTFEINLGTDRVKILPELRILCDDLEFQLKNHSYSLEEASVRFSHRLVQIHPFPNGNGRCSRLLADLIMIRNGRERFTWGRKKLTEISEARTQYISALKEADNFNISLTNRT